ncbi:MAG: HPr family phosphocarrier protein [Acetobacteraceae bacterium]|nr:HPr family phosphocarrier protein [Acetobacteraceae bacterium]
MADEAAGTGALHGSVVLPNRAGLHARPAVKLTQLAKTFSSRIDFALDPDGPWIDAKSPVKVMRAKASQGSTLYFRTLGPDAGPALKALLDLAGSGFGEE